MKQQFNGPINNNTQYNSVQKSWWREFIESLIIALLVVFFLTNFVFTRYSVPTGSAEPTMLVGDCVWGNKMAYLFGSPVQRGELVIFDNPETPYDTDSKIQYYWQRYIGIALPFFGLKAGPINVVKRVIAIPGDTIEGKIEDGKTVIYRNGTKLTEPYVNPLPLIRVFKETGFIPFKQFGPFSIPASLQRSKNIRNYTFDPAKSLEQQPYYAMNATDIILHPATGKNILSLPLDPIYHDVGLMKFMEFNQTDYFKSVDEFGPITLPEGKYWMMGDSRKNSHDSRYWKFLDRSLIRGRASFIIYSIDTEEYFWFFEWFKHPIDFWTKKVRWNRFFTSLSQFNGIE